VQVDVWSAAVIHYQLLYGKRPFGEGLTQERILREDIMLNARNVTFPAKPTVSQECKDFIVRCSPSLQERCRLCFPFRESLSSKLMTMRHFNNPPPPPAAGWNDQATGFFWGGQAVSLKCMHPRKALFFNAGVWHTGSKTARTCSLLLRTRTCTSSGPDSP